jgi:glutathione S-transferase
MQVLVRSDPAERLEAFARLLDGLRAFAKQGRANNALLVEQPGPGSTPGRDAQPGGGFWGGGSSLGYVDCALLPYAYRLYVLEHYRGPAFAVPRPPPGTAGDAGQQGRSTDAADEEVALWAWYHAWLAKCAALPHVKRTLPDQARYLAHVQKYAEGLARSKVGNAVRRGADAHAYDDKLDGDSQ